MARRATTSAAEVTCRRCGRPCIDIATDYGLTHRIDGAPLPIDTDLRAIRHARRSVWVFNPESGCWTSKFGVRRDWRDTRAEHLCTPTKEEAKAS